MTEFFLSGNSINLRTINEDDLDGNYKNWFNDKEVCAHNDHHRFPMLKEELRAYYENVIKTKDSLVLAIIDKETNKHVGNISLQNIDMINRSAEFAIIIGEKEAWGKGFGKEAGEMIINHGFKSLNLHRIYCGTSVDNMPMQKLAGKLGFIEEGRLKDALYKDGAYKDIVRYGIISKL